MAIAALSTCRDAETDAPALTRIDSAGVEIVTSNRPMWTESEGWRVNPKPLVSIGEVEGDAPYVFGDVVGAARVGDSIAVADGQAFEIRTFGLDGIHTGTFGRQGQGPGELASLYQLWRCAGNLLYAFDIRGLKVQMRGADGTFIRDLRVLEPSAERPRRPYTLRCSSEGPGFLGAGWGDLVPSGIREGVVFPQMAPVWLFDDEGRVVQDLGQHLSSQRYATIGLNGRVGGTGPHPLGSATSFALSAERIYIGSGEAFEVDVLDRDGVLVQRLRGPPDPTLTITESIVDAYRSAELGENDELERQYLERAGFPMPEAMPAYVDMRVDPDGALWLRRFTPPWESLNRWAVFAPDGAFLGHVELPAGVQLADLGRDWVLGVEADELGVERVLLFSLDKG